uniref:Hexosyltransferase n=1 Tax=Pseudonaja textilis TaxID=8673 RepID=A0A670Y144_PSETE
MVSTITSPSRAKLPFWNFSPLASYFQFSVASDDNSEFWFSSDETPANIRLVAFVGKLGSEWTAPGEFTKFSSQVSKPIRVLSSRRYYFELLHKQDDRGSDHVEVGWRIFLPSFKFEVIDSPYISLYTDESSLKMNEVDHVPQSLASHADSYLWGAQRDEHGADMLKPDPRDIFFLTPKIEPSHVENVLVPCAYSPTYVVKDFPIARYQGLQFVSVLMECFNRNCTNISKPEKRGKVNLGRENWEGIEKRKGSPKEEKQSKKETNKPPEKVYVTRLQPSKKKAPSQKDVFPGVFLYPRSPRKVQWNSRIPQGRPAPSNKLHSPSARRTSLLVANTTKETGLSKRKGLQVSRKWEPFYGRKPFKGSIKRQMHPSALGGPEKTQEEEVEEEVSDYSYENSEIQQSWLEDSINWQRTFSVSPVDFELLRSDWNDLRCNVSGNLQLSESEVVDVVAQYMEKLNEKNGGIYTLLRIINVEKRRDTARGNRYLMELELMEKGQRTVRLSEYIYVLLHQGKSEDSTEVNPEGPATVSTQSQASPSAWSLLYGKPILCRPLRLSWRHDVMIHFVVPVKNQARWVQQFISDMASLFLNTKDANFNIILVDFDSDDMHVEKALQEAHLPRYQYLKRTGNFERSAGLQAGVDAIEDGSSIVFLCDLHIHFPLNILDSIRKHCVEGKLAYAPIVMRLGCGSSPREPNGYWEVNGFGLFGIYKSDFDRIGGMNTEEFRDRWGGEDWELLDRVLQSGLEVERLRLRNFYHYYHSKRGMWNSHNKKTPKD